MAPRTTPSILLAGLLLASSGALAAEPATTSCGLLSQAAASALYGAPLDPPREMLPSCAYFGAGGDDKTGVVFVLIAIPGAPMAGMYSQYVHSDPAARIEPVAGLGDEADFVTRTDDDGTTITLDVLAHNKIYALGATASPNPDIKAAILQETRRILAGR